MIARLRAVEPAAIWRLLRYSAVSVAGVAITQALLVAGHAGLHLAAGTANVAAVLGASLPVFFLNRRWVWSADGQVSLRGEVLPFWAFTIAGLVLSTLAVAGAAAITDSTLAVSAANIGAFGVLWVAKFFVLDRVVFAAVQAAAAEALAEPTVATT